MSYLTFKYVPKSEHKVIRYVCDFSSSKSNEIVQYENEKAEWYVFLKDF